MRNIASTNAPYDARQKAAPYLRSIPQSSDAVSQAAGIYQQMGEITGQVIHVNGGAYLG